MYTLNCNLFLGTFSSLPLLAGAYRDDIPSFYQTRLAGVTRLEESLEESISSEVPSTYNEFKMYVDKHAILPSINHKRDRRLYPNFYYSLRYKSYGELVREMQSPQLKIPRENLESTFPFKHNQALILFCSLTSLAIAISLHIFNEIVPKLSNNNLFSELYYFAFLSFLPFIISYFGIKGRSWLKLGPALQTWANSESAIPLMAAAMVFEEAKESSLDIDELDEQLYAVAARHLYENAHARDEDALECRHNLKRLAQIVGCSHAAHYLWILQQKGYGEEETNLANWNYDEEIVLSVGAMHMDYDSIDKEFAKKRLKLALLESKNFRQTFLKKWAGENHEELDEFIVLAKRAERTYQTIEDRLNRKNMPHSHVDIEDKGNIGTELLRHSIDTTVLQSKHVRLPDFAEDESSFLRVDEAPQETAEGLKYQEELAAEEEAQVLEPPSKDTNFKYIKRIKNE